MKRLLDLYSCSGGAAVGYHRAGFEVVGVDIIPQPNYPFEHHVGDALEFLAAHWWEFDGIHASPPCQSSSAPTKGTNKKRNAEKGIEHPDLIAATRKLLDSTGKPYILENVQGSEVRRDMTLCGLMFGLKVFRHRYFELGGWTGVAPIHPSHRGHRVSGWRHGVKYEGDMFAVYGKGGGKGTIPEWQDAMGIDWTDVHHELTEAIPPAYSEYIGKQLMETL